MLTLYNEIDSHAAQWLRNLAGSGQIAKGFIDERPLQDIPSVDLFGYDRVHWFAGIGVWDYALRLADWPREREVWTGSCPCQPFSAAGKGEGFADERHLWPYWLHHIRVCRPATIFGEQVASKAGLEWLDLVRSDLEGEGYAFGVSDLCAASIGAPHIRQRLFFVADSNRKRCDGEPIRLLAGETRQAGFEASGGSADGLVANAAERGSGAGLLDNGQAQLWRSEPSNMRADGLVANAESFGLLRRSDDGDNGRRQRASGPGCEADQLVTPCKRFSVCAYPDECRSPDECCDRARSEARTAEQWDWDEAGGLCDAYFERLGGRRLPEGGRSNECVARPAGGSVRSGPTNSFWSDPDWLFCTDGKWRPVEPGSFPLVDGSAFKLGAGGPYAGKSRAKMLRGYGNAIVAPLAAEFVKAAMDALRIR
ncbi:MAG TPA: DNA cytosine methyltransferase [Rhizomicrobium sp.]|nr:DNA cytosine methyltransferase [Rhizomicrobium sp.]